MIILGINDTTHDCGATLFEDGKVLAAVNEERITREKMKGGWPRESIKEVFELANLDYEKADRIAVSSIFTPGLSMRAFRKTQENIKQWDIFYSEKLKWQPFVTDVLQFRLNGCKKAPKDSFFGNLEQNLAKRFIKRDLPRELRDKQLKIYEHHLTHAASAYYVSGKSKVLCITMDGIGDGLSYTASICNNGEMKRIQALDVDASFGFFYSLITAYLGFKPYRHEGKIVGLAAFGNPKNVKVEFPFKWENDAPVYQWDWGYGATKYLKQLDDYVGALGKYKGKDIAAWLQVNTEKFAAELVKKAIRKTKIYDLALAGGVFANVKLNQRIHEIPGVKSMFIFPHMGDGGLASGAAFLEYHDYLKEQGKTFTPAYLQNVYFGPEFSEKEILESIKRHKLNYSYHRDIEKQIAKLLSQSYIVARFNGKMEYGPRALGNRSVLYHAKDPDVNEWLNKALERTEFMPFAPSTLYESRKKCYKNVEGAEHAAEFMTITFDCTPFMRKNSPAAVHIDGTARPQLVKKEVNPSYHKILSEYKKITGIPSVVNTSFNMHEEPIVRSPDDAIRAFKLGRLDYLAIGNCLIKNEDSPRVKK